MRPGCVYALFTCALVLSGCGDVLAPHGGQRYELISIGGKPLPQVQFVSKSPDSPRPDTIWIVGGRITLLGDSASVMEDMLVQKIAGGTTTTSAGLVYPSYQVSGDSIAFSICVPDAGCGHVRGAFHAGEIRMIEQFWEDTAYVPVVWVYRRP